MPKCVCTECSREFEPLTRRKRCRDCQFIFESQQRQLKAAQVRAKALTPEQAARKMAYRSLRDAGLNADEANAAAEELMDDFKRFFTVH